MKTKTKLMKWMTATLCIAATGTVTVCGGNDVQRLQPHSALWHRRAQLLKNMTTNVKVGMM